MACAVVSWLCMVANRMCLRKQGCNINMAGAVVSWLCMVANRMCAGAQGKGQQEGRAHSTQERVPRTCITRKRVPHTHASHKSKCHTHASHKSKCHTHASHSILLECFGPCHRRLLQKAHDTSTHELKCCGCMDPAGSCSVHS
eukprot:1152509-Pelagomonas_calceolata.AAC.3